MEDRAKAMHALAVAVKDGNTDALDALMDKILAAEKAVHEADDATHAKVREILTPAQAAKFFLFHEKFHDEVKMLLGDAKHGMPGEKMMVGNPEDALLQKADMLMHAERFDDALAVIGKALDVNPKNPSCYILRAQVRLHKDDVDGALHDMEHAIELAPKEPKLRLFRADIRSKQGDTKGAIQDYDAFMELAPDAPEIPKIKKRIAELRGDR